MNFMNNFTDLTVVYAVGNDEEYYLYILLFFS
jgi:hypothetical protein